MKLTIKTALLFAAVSLVALSGSAQESADEASREDAIRPQNDAGRVQAQRKSGRAWWSMVAERGWLGVRMSTKDEAKRIHDSAEWPEAWIKVPNLRWVAEGWDGDGALVLEVFPETPAERAGVLPGDVIVSFNGIRTSSPGVLAFVVQRVLIGRDANIELLRDDDKRIVLAEIGMHPEDLRRKEAEEAAKRAEEATVEADSAP